MKQFVEIKDTNEFLSSFGYVKIRTPMYIPNMTDVWVSNGRRVETPALSTENYSHGAMRGGQRYGVINGHIVYETSLVFQPGELEVLENGVTVCTVDALYRILPLGVIPRKVSEPRIKQQWHFTTEGLAKAKRLKEEQKAAHSAKCEEFIDGLGIYEQARREQIRAYLKELDNFDWYYSFSDDSSVYRSCKRREDELRQMAKDLGIPELFEKAAALYTYNR